jgi:hypothetical protein
MDVNGYVINNKQDAISMCSTYRIYFRFENTVLMVFNLKTILMICKWMLYFTDIRVSLKVFSLFTLILKLIFHTRVCEFSFPFNFKHTT